jgi:alanine dehydrogenase
VIAFTAEDSHRYGSPNCEAAGKQGALMGLYAILSINGGKGKFVSGLGGAPGMKVLILGGGVVGQAALSVLHALGAWVTVMDINIGTLRSLSRQYHEQVNTMISTRENIAALLPETDMVLNCVKWPKDRTDHLIDREMVRTMGKGSVIVDISNDVGVIETFRETTHEEPCYIEEGVVHYCVSNIPGAIANSTSVAYAASVLPHFRNILNLGVAEACVRDGFLRRSLTAYKGYLTHEETSALQGRPWIRPEDILGISGKKLDMAPPATVSRSENYICAEDVAV